MNQKLKSINTQKVIINTSFNLFYKNGYNKTTIPEIMKATKLTKGAFYHHFKNKEDLGEKVISFVLYDRVFCGMIKPLFNFKKENTIKLLRDVFTKRILSFSDKEKKLGCPINSLINEIGQSEKLHRIVLRRIIDKWKTSLIEVIKYGREKKEINNSIDPLSTAVFLISSYEGVRGIRKVYDDDKLLYEYLKSFEFYIEQLKY